MSIYKKCSISLPVLGSNLYESYYSGSELLNVYVREDIEDAIRYLLEKFDGFNGLRFFSPGCSKWSAFM